MRVEKQCFKIVETFNRSASLNMPEASTAASFVHFLSGFLVTYACSQGQLASKLLFAVFFQAYRLLKNLPG